MCPSDSADRGPIADITKPTRFTQTEHASGRLAHLGYCPN